MALGAEGQRGRGAEGQRRKQIKMFLYSYGRGATGRRGYNQGFQELRMS